MLHNVAMLHTITTHSEIRTHSSDVRTHYVTGDIPRDPIMIDTNHSRYYTDAVHYSNATHYNDTHY